MKTLNNKRMYPVVVAESGGCSEGANVPIFKNGASIIPSVNVLYRWRFLTLERIDLMILRDRSTGQEQATYRKLLENCTKEMEQLTPRLEEIFKRIKSYHTMKAIMAIYCEDISYQDWAETCDISVDSLYHEINEALEAIDRDLMKEAA